MAKRMSQSLLGPGDPPPAEICNPHGRIPGLLLCDHASAAIPWALGDLWLVAGQRRLHIAWDIGAADVTRLRSAKLDGAAILACYSRLLVDCNRQLVDPTSFPHGS